MPFKYLNGRNNAVYWPTGQVEDGRPYYMVTEPFSYCDPKFRYPRIDVPEGFITDLASIPTIPLMPNPGGTLWDDAAIVHDVALTKLSNHAHADAIFYYALLERGCSVFTATVFWSAVRVGSIVRKLKQ